MRRPLLALAAVAAVLVPAASARAGDGEPVQLSVEVPVIAASNVGFPLVVTVTADRGALDAASSPLRVRVRAARECGASFDSTPGATLLDKQLGSAGRVSGTALTHVFGAFTACAFLEQTSDARLFAFDDSAGFTITHPCTTFSRRAIAAKRALKEVLRSEKRAHGAHRAALHRRAAHLRAKLRRANIGRKRNCRT
jgi:hypothetical protein